MRKFMKPSYVAAAVLTLGALGWIFTGDLSQATRHLGLNDEKPSAVAPVDKAQEAKPEKPLVAVRVRRMSAEERVREITVTGRSDVVRDAEVTAETAGRIVELVASKGQWLEQGDLILRLAMDDRKSKLEDAVARVEFERIGYEAARKLSKKGFQSEVKLAQEKSEWEKAKADLAAIRLDIARTEIRAPITGYLDTLPVGVGDYLKSGDKIVTMVSPDPMRVVINVSEQDVGFLSVGDTAVARAINGRAFEGRVKYISQRAEEATRTFRVDVWIKNPDMDLRDGLTMEVILRAGFERAHRVSPAILTLNDAGAIGVKYVDNQSQVQFQPVRIIAHTPQGVWLSDLPDTVEVITVGQEFVTEGQKVERVNETALTVSAGGRP